MLPFTPCSLNITHLLPGLLGGSVAPLLLGDGVVGNAAETILGSPADIDALTTGGRLVKSAGTAAVRDVALDLAGADIDVAGVGRLPVGRSGRLFGQRKLSLALLDGLGVGAVDTRDGAVRN